jgi:hypothetical protein
MKRIHWLALTGLLTTGCIPPHRFLHSPRLPHPRPRVHGPRHPGAPPHLHTPTCGHLPGPGRPGALPAPPLPPPPSPPGIDLPGH